MNSRSGRGTAAHHTKPNLHGAATPLPIPEEPENPQILPLPKVEPRETQPRPEIPQPSASHEDFAEFTAKLLEHYVPYNSEQKNLVEKLAECRWALNQRKRVFDSIESAVYVAQPDPKRWSADDFKRLGLADMYRAEAEEIVERAQKNVDEFIRQRGDDYRWEAMYHLAVRRFEFQKKKFEIEARSAGIGEQGAAVGA